MTLELCVLASGSAGNASIVRSPSGALLIDAGIGPRTLAQRLSGTGTGLADVSAVCLTHLDGDHFSSSLSATLRRLDIPIYCHADQVDILAERASDLVHLIRPFGVEAFSPIEGLTCEPVRFAHDRLGSHGFVIDGFGYRIGYATDLGHVPRHFFDRFSDLDSIALESNYDHQMQIESARPSFLKRRITGGHGHLSNSQALAAVRKLLDRSRRLPDHIVLLHRSEECNCPHLVRQNLQRRSEDRVAPHVGTTARAVAMARPRQSPGLGWRAADVLVLSLLFTKVWLGHTRLCRIR